MPKRVVVAVQVYVRVSGSCKRDPAEKCTLEKGRIGGFFFPDDLILK